MNRGAACMSRSGTVDESCRHNRSILRHRIDAGFSSVFHPDSPRFYRLAKFGMNLGESWPESGMSDWGFRCSETAWLIKAILYLEPPVWGGGGGGEQRFL